MGITNDAVSLQALTATNGDVQAALDLIFADNLWHALAVINLFGMCSGLGKKNWGGGGGLKKKKEI